VSASPIVRTEAPVVVLRMMALAAAVLERPLMVSLKPFNSRMVRWLASAPLNPTLPLSVPLGSWSLAPRRRMVVAPVLTPPKSTAEIEVLPE
jgi:hypothetical protein